MTKEKQINTNIDKLLAYIDALYKGNVLSLANYTDIKRNINDIKESVEKMTYLKLVGKITYLKEELKELKSNKEIAKKKKELDKEIIKKEKELKDICHKYLEIKKACGNIQLIKMGLDFAGITLILYSIVWIIKLF